MSVMPNQTVLGLTHYAVATQTCYDCSIARLKHNGLAHDEIREIMGVRSDSQFSRMFNAWPIRYAEHTEYYVAWFEDTERYELVHKHYRGSRLLSMHNFTNQDIDKLIYLKHSSANGTPIAMVAPSSTDDTFILTMRNYYLEDKDYAQLSRVLSHTGVTDVNIDFEAITDSYPSKGSMVVCDDCHSVIIEEHTMNCVECSIQIATGRTAYALEYGDSLSRFNGMPHYMRLCMSCYLDIRDKVEKAIMIELRNLWSKTGNKVYADYAFIMSLDSDFCVMYRELKQAQANAPIEEAAIMLSTIETAFYEVVCEDLDKNPYMCHEMIETLDETFKNE